MTRRILAIDTSTDIASVAVVQGSTLLAQQEAPDAARHDHILLPRIESVLRDAGLSLPELELLAVGIGPGAFGGLRVGLATLKGLALATGVPMVGVSSLRALACCAPQEASLVVSLLDARRGELYAALYEREGDQLLERVAPFMATPAEAAARIQATCSETPHAVGDGFRAHRAALAEAWPSLVSQAHSDEPPALPHARHIASIAQAQFAIHGADDLAALLPLYIRDSDAKLPAKPLQLPPE